MHFSHSWFFQWLSQYAYEPLKVYLGVFFMMIASGFGFPLPEEVQIISVGILAYMGAHPDLFPPPFHGAPVVNGYEAALVVSAAVIFSDNLVFWIGRTFGRRLMKIQRLKRLFESPMMTKIHHYAHKYGVYAAFIFRFTPGLRFPAHIFLGMSHFSAIAFFLVDSLAVLISVPTQILLVYHFGEPFLGTLYKFKVYVGVILALALVYFVARRLLQKRSAAASE
jgi:membrane protein DedA with SNARE-associated domain